MISIIRKIFESSFLINLFTNINIARIFYKIDTNLWHAHQR